MSKVSFESFLFVFKWEELIDIGDLMIGFHFFLLLESSVIKVFFLVHGIVALIDFRAILFSSFLWLCKLK
jgi:hypothetical protein